MSKSLDERVRELAARDRGLAAKILAESIRIPADHVAEDPSCGLSNHEGPRLEYMKKTLWEIGAIRKEEDAFFDTYGNLVWEVYDPNDGIAAEDKRVIYFDGHTDTVKALRDQWTAKIGPGVDAYEGRRDGAMDPEFLKRELGHMPAEGEWDDHLLFGRGAADQLGGVVAQIVSSRILMELADEGSLKGVIIRSYATTAEEDNDGGGPKYLMEQELPGAGAEKVPDVVILTEGTGDAQKGALGIYRGQRGRMQIQVTVTGRSCHGSMPWEGLNPLEFGAAIVVEAANAYDKREGFLDDPFLGHGTRTASWAHLDSPSDCAVPDKFTFRFDRRLTVGESPEQAVLDVENLPAVGRALEAGLKVTVEVPQYNEPTWRGYIPGNPQIYPGWATPEAHPAVQTAVDTYNRVVAPDIDAGGTAGQRRTEPRVDRWIFSTDGVGFPVPSNDDRIKVSARKDWVDNGTVKHPPMFGFGPGIEQNTHKIGECLDLRELEKAIAFLARFPSLYAQI
jgi:putative selenium metabolism hydrolase